MLKKKSYKFICYIYIKDVQGILDISLLLNIYLWTIYMPCVDTNEFTNAAVCRIRGVCLSLVIEMVVA